MTPPGALVTAVFLCVPCLGRGRMPSEPPGPFAGGECPFCGGEGFAFVEPLHPAIAARVRERKEEERRATERSPHAARVRRPGREA